MNRERVRIRVPFRADVIPRGGRVPREVVYADELVADIRVVPARDLPVAVRLSEGGDRHRIQRLDYFGFDDDLWLPLLPHERDGLRLTPERVVAAIAAGEEYVGRYPNPFLELSGRPMKPAEAAGAGRIEAAALRSVKSDDRARSLGRAARLADDLVFTDDGRVLRRSPGVFHFFRNDGPALLPCLHDLPDIAVFGSCRFAEAAEYAHRHLGYAELPREAPGLEVIHPEFVRDHDPLILARAMVPQNTALIARVTRPECDPAGDLAGIVAEAAVGRIHGVDAEELPQRFYAESARVQGTATPSVAEIVEAVAAIRSFFTDHVPQRAGTSIVSTVERMRETVRWDECELPRLGYGISVPDFSGLDDIAVPSGIRP